MSSTNLNKSPASTEHRNRRWRSDSNVTFDEQVRTYTIPTAPTTPLEPNFSLPGNLTSLGPTVATQPTEFGKVIVANARTILSQWEHIQNQESSVKWLPSGTDADPHCLPSLRIKCQLKISDRYKDNERTQMALATYLDLHAEYIKKLCHRALEIARIELSIAKEALQEKLVQFLGIVSENLLLIDQSINGKDQWSAALTKQERISLVSERAVLQILVQDFDYLHSNNHRTLSLLSTTTMTPVVSPPPRK